MEEKILFREGVEHIYSIAFDTLLLFGLTASPFWSTLVVNRVEFSVCVHLQNVCQRPTMVGVDTKKVDTYRGLLRGKARIMEGV